MTLRQITYISTRSLGFDDAALADMIENARRNNARDGMTGLLVSNGVNFLQTFEGPTAAADQLLERILRDNRHSGVRIISDLSVHQRLFANWSMEHASAQADQAQHREIAVDWPFESEMPATSELAQLYTGFLSLARA